MHLVKMNRFKINILAEIITFNTFLDCTSGFYAQRCEKKCGNCKAGFICDSTTGRCPNGCLDHWLPPYCTSIIL